MTTPDIQLARVWAERVDKIEGLPSESRAAVEAIRSLPDTVVDGDKLREVINKVLANTVHGTVGHQVAEDYAALIGELIPATSLPTLADMTPEEREACRWMQADVKLANGGSATCVIANPRMPGARVRVWAPHGGSDDIEEGRVTPLPDLPPLKWPAQEPRNPETPPAETLNNTSSDTPRNPRPEDVPAGEPWIVQNEGLEWVGVRANDFRIPWSITNMDGLDYRDVDDWEITLVSRLVPETP